MKVLALFVVVSSLQTVILGLLGAVFLTESGPGRSLLLAEAGLLLPSMAAGLLDCCLSAGCCLECSGSNIHVDSVLLFFCARGAAAAASSVGVAVFFSNDIRLVHDRSINLRVARLVFHQRRHIVE